MDRIHVVLLLLLLGSFQAYGFNVYSLGGTDGNPWPAALSFQPGEYIVVDAQGTVIDRGRVRSPSTYATWRETLTVAVDSLDGQWLRPFFVPDTLNLARDGVRERIQRGRGENLTTSDLCYWIPSQLLPIRKMVDGDPTTAAFFPVYLHEESPERSRNFVQNAIVDLGADYPVNRIRFFPRLGREHPRVEHWLEAMEPPRLRYEDLDEEDFSANFLPRFEVSGMPGWHAIPADCSTASRLGVWFQRIPLTIEDAPNDPRFTRLRRETDSRAVIADIRFPTQPFQWLALRPLTMDRPWEIAEFQIFGQGYVYRAVYTSSVLDWGEPVVLGQIRWQGEKDEDGQILIHTRSGVTPDPNRYWIATSLPGEFREGTRLEYERASAAERQVTPDYPNWSFWSPPYAWEAGQRDPPIPSHRWTDGTPILSPGPSRYFQLQLVFLSTPTAAVRLRNLELQFSRPAARKVVGEIWPLVASRTQRTTFTYTVRPTLVDGNLGFDRLEIFTLTRVDTVRSVTVDAQEMSIHYPPRILDDRIIVRFPRLQGKRDTAKLVEVQFDARVVLYGTEFRGWVYDSQGPGVKQLVIPGDAVDQLPGNTLSVRTDSLGGSLLTQVEVAPNPFTPNGDGINEAVYFRFQVHEITVPRLLSVQLFDLSGGRVRSLEPLPVMRGVFDMPEETLSWNGRDDQGRPVAPGIYLYRLRLEVDDGREERIGTLSVVY